MLPLTRFAKLNKPPLSFKPPPPLSKVLEKNKPPGVLNRGFTVLPFTEQGSLSFQGYISNNFSGSLLGDHCQKCSDGWYGNAKNGTPHDCRPCPCPGGPLASNQFAKTCFANETDGLPTCNNCSQGITGRNCEMCMDGYFGRPWVSRRKNEPQIVYLTTKEASTVLLAFWPLCGSVRTEQAHRKIEISENWSCLPKVVYFITGARWTVSPL